MQYNLHSEDDDLQEIAPLLSKIPKKAIQAPEGYFEQFPNMIMSEVAKEKKDFNWLSIAATILIMLGIGVTLHLLEHQHTVHNNLTESNIITDHYLYEIDESTLIEFASTSEVSVKQSSKVEELIIENYTEAELLEHYN